ncbi:MAG: EVE domain-containing protein [Halobacteriovoraceae bacterium]|nr:EVE domain-containing protein [Halobacteriovoraceae bacterium]|tara:strand:+ start:17750 stop:18217 length:468 start_codon:yes stop_codon:yes gene_type:complete
MKSTPQYWLMKSEPDEFGIDDLKSVGKEAWSGVRNYQARNFMRDEMKVGDEVLFYHSSTKPPGVAGVAVVASKPYADPTQFDSKSPYFDPKSKEDDPRWILVDLKFKKKFKNYIPLSKLKECSELEDMTILQKGNRLSITPVTKKEFDFICELGS